MRDGAGMVRCALPYCRRVEGKFPKDKIPQGSERKQREV